MVCLTQHSVAACGIPAAQARMGVLLLDEGVLVPGTLVSTRVVVVGRTFIGYSQWPRSPGARRYSPALQKRLSVPPTPDGRAHATPIVQAFPSTLLSFVRTS